MKNAALIISLLSPLSLFCMPHYRHPKRPAELTIETSPIFLERFSEESFMLASNNPAVGSFGPWRPYIIFKNKNDITFKRSINTDTIPREIDAYNQHALSLTRTDDQISLFLPIKKISGPFENQQQYGFLHYLLDSNRNCTLCTFYPLNTNGSKFSVSMISIEMILRNIPTQLFNSLHLFATLNGIDRMLVKNEMDSVSLFFVRNLRALVFGLIIR